jgi:hypothetical protein
VRCAVAHRKSRWAIPEDAAKAARKAAAKAVAGDEA